MVFIVLGAYTPPSRKRSTVWGGGEEREGGKGETHEKGRRGLREEEEEEEVERKVSWLFRDFERGTCFQPWGGERSF